MSYLPNTLEDRAHMLTAIGVRTVEDLFQIIPPELRIQSIDIEDGLCELDVATHVAALAGLNQPPGSRSFLGAGCYNHFVPAAVRALCGRAEFLTSYTPYQPEVSQGTLQAIFEFQTAICELAGLEIANASLYDGPSAAAEAVLLALRETKRRAVLVSAGLHPETQEVLRTYASGPRLDVNRLKLDPPSGRTTLPSPADLNGAGALVVQQPNFFGVIEDLVPLAQVAHEAGALLVVSQNPMTLGVLEAPGRLGADIVVGDVQVFGNAMSFGGPSAGYLACREAHLRQIPGRLVGQTVDADGRTCYCLTLQAREQHIRRAKAASSICSNQALNALAATIYLALLGPVGLRQLGEVCLQRAHYLAASLAEIPGITPLFGGPFFHEFSLRLSQDADRFVSAMLARGIAAGVSLGRFEGYPRDALLVAVTEINRATDLDAYLDAAQEVLAEPSSVGKAPRAEARRRPIGTL